MMLRIFSTAVAIAYWPQICNVYLSRGENCFDKEEKGKRQVSPFRRKRNNIGNTLGNMCIPGESHSQVRKMLLPGEAAPAHSSDQHRDSR